MKIQIGTKLQAIRGDRKLTQEEMAEILNMSVSAYGRVERNEQDIAVSELYNYSKALKIPIHELLPDTFTVNNTNHGQASVVFGNVYFNCNFGDSVKQDFLQQSPEAKN